MNRALRAAGTFFIVAFFPTSVERDSVMMGVVKKRKIPSRGAHDGGPGHVIGAPRHRVIWSVTKVTAVAR